MCDWLTQRPKKKRKKNVKKKKVTAVMFAWCASSTNKRETILLVYNRCLPTATIPHHHQFYGEGVWRRHLSSTRHEKIERKREMDGVPRPKSEWGKKKRRGIWWTVTMIALQYVYYAYTSNVANLQRTLKQFFFFPVYSLHSTVLHFLYYGTLFLG